MHTHTETEHCGLLWSGAQVMGDRDYDENIRLSVCRRAKATSSQLSAFSSQTILTLALERGRRLVCSDWRDKHLVLLMVIVNDSDSGVLYRPDL